MGMLPAWALCGPPPPPSERNVTFNAQHGDPAHLTNHTSTTKYNLFTFLPKALFEQYRRVANWYFTVVAALSLTQFSPVRPWTTWLPLGIVLGVSLVKEAIEDYKRYKADKDVNSREVAVLNVQSGAFETRKWQELHTGQVVQVNRDEFFPADLLFLAAENEEGTCYIETMNLDGETNLKIKQAQQETSHLALEAGGLCKFQGSIQCEAPNSRLYQFAGNLLVPGGDKVPISPGAILLRGCSLRNTSRVYGLVVYAGHDTKVFMNSTAAPSKRSQIEYIVDKVIFFMFFLLFSFCTAGAIADSNFIGNDFSLHWYLAPEATNVQYDPSHPASAGGTNFVTSFILYGYLIPISLYVSMEMVKITQSMVFISSDLHMYHEESDTPALARTSNLNEDLGMVNTILSDKTGTLTCNVMEFFKCSIAGVSYGDGHTEIEKTNYERRNGAPMPEKAASAVSPHRERFFNFSDPRLMDGAWTRSQDAEHIAMFFRMLAVCHTVVPDGPATPGEITYEAESPDEAAFVVAAKALGFFFMKRNSTSVVVRETTVSGESDVQYQVLNVLEFNSTRKRMSVIVQDSKGRILLFCKGADTVIYHRLDPASPQNQRFKGPTEEHMDEYGSAGLRTLCLSYAELDPAFYKQWQEKYMKAKTSIDNRSKLVEEVSELVEQNLVLLGCTAIEDKLQDGVPQCISLLAEAGIRLWVLTGDKMETAINIGFACSLITEEMKQFIVTMQSTQVEELEAAGDMDAAAQQGSALVEQQLQAAKAAIAAGKGGSTQYAMIIDGKTLSYALAQRLAPLFLEVGMACQAVICCRVSPLQKAQVTALAKSYGHVTVAIGDGANDVGMIQKAHIGVGISGQEGMQAVMAADFAIAQFRFLAPLLLVHGRWSYKRITRMINFFFFKNILFGLTLFVFNSFTRFSGQYMYSDVYMTLYNVVFTALTPIVVGIFDRDVSRGMETKYPRLYKQGQRNSYLNFWTIAGWILSAAYMSGIVLVIGLVGCPPTTISRSAGSVYGMYEVGVLMFSCIVLTVHLQITSVEEQWTWLHHFAIWGSQLLWWLFLLIFDIMPLSISQDLWHLFLHITAAGPQYWLYCLLVPVACLLPDFFFRAVKRHLYPEDHELVMEEQHLAGTSAAARHQPSVKGSQVAPEGKQTQQPAPACLPEKELFMNSKGPGESGKTLSSVYEQVSEMSQPDDGSRPWSQPEAASLQQQAEPLASPSSSLEVASVEQLPSTEPAAGAQPRILATSSSRQATPRQT